jgi:hypothetical protein
MRWSRVNPTLYLPLTRRHYSAAQYASGKLLEGPITSTKEGAGLLLTPVLWVLGERFPHHYSPFLCSTLPFDRHRHIKHPASRRT